MATYTCEIICEAAVINKHEHWTVEKNNHFMHLAHSIVWFWNVDTDQKEIKKLEAFLGVVLQDAKRELEGKEIKWSDS